MKLKNVTRSTSFLLLYVCVFFSSTGVAATSFRAATPLVEIIAQSDAILIGEIISVSKNTFSFQIQKEIIKRRPLLNSTLQIAYKKRSTVEPRWAPYQTGQIILVFVKKSDELDNVLWSFSAMPNDSEWPVIGKNILFYDRYIQGLAIKQRQYGKYQFYAQSLDINIVISAIVNLSNCFQPKTDSLKKPLWLYKICNESGLKAYSKQSKLHHHLVIESKEYFY